MGIRLKKFKPTEYVTVVKRGKAVKSGQGLTVLYNDIHTDIMVAPVTAFDGTFTFDDLVTADYQTVCVQGALTYMIDNYEQAYKMADFTFGRNYEEKKALAMELFCKRLNNVIRAIVIRETGKMDVRNIIKCADEMADLITEGLLNDEAVATLGIKILAVNILGIVARPDTRKALEAAAREQILKEQDDAIYLRRNAAIEQERLIKENELNTEIKVAEKEKEKKEKEQDIKRRLLETNLEMKQFEVEEKIKLEQRNKDFVDLEVENEKKRADEKAYEIAQIMKAYENVNVALIEACALANMDPKALMAKAFMELGENAGKIGTLNMTPDLLETIVGGNHRR